MDEIEVVEVGEYIRTDDGIIAKVNNIDELRIDIPTDRAVYRIWVDDYYGNHKEDRFIKSHSKNIIDLIEVGDYVNGRLVLEKYQRPYDGQWQLECGDVRYEDSDIKIILTREMYAQNCYEVGED